MSDITVSESGDYYYIMQGESDADCWPQYKEAASPDEEIIIYLCGKVLYLQKQLEQLQAKCQRRKESQIKINTENKELKARNEKLEQIVKLTITMFKNDNSYFDFNHDDCEILKKTLDELNEVK